MASQYYWLGDFVEALNAWGLTDVLLPFLLIFTIIFAILHKTRVFGAGKKNINLVVALVFGLAVVVPHITGTYPPNGDIVVIMNTALPNVSIVLVAFVAMLIMVGLFSGEFKWMGGSLSEVVAIVSFIIILIIFGFAAGWWSFGTRWHWWFTDFVGSDAVALIVIILVFGIIIWFVTRDTDADKAARLKQGAGELRDFLGK